MKGGIGQSLVAKTDVKVRTTTTSNFAPSSSLGSPFSSTHTAFILSGASPSCAARALYRSTDTWLMSTPTMLFT